MSTADFNTDTDRLPAGFKRTGYDTDAQTYFFTSPDGETWKTEPGNQYGKLTRVKTGEWSAYVAASSQHSRTELDSKKEGVVRDFLDVDASEKAEVVHVEIQKPQKAIVREEKGI